MLLRQLFDGKSCTYTYLLGDRDSLESVIIDPVLDLADRDIKLAQELNLKIKYILETHIHADHITGAGKIKSVFDSQLVLGEESTHPQADILLKDGDMINFGKFQIKGIATPGHTKSCTSYFLQNMLFTGDALFIRGCGRTDFQGGSAKNLYMSVRKKIFSYPDNTLIYPGHDYNGRTVSTVGEEKKYNLRLKMDHSLEDFCNIMNNLNLPYPELMDEAVPKNLNCLNIT